MATILVIEDERDLCNLIRFHLEQDGHTVQQAFDGREGLALADKHTLDLVILDWMLLGLDGLAACRQIRQQHLMPIIMLTACSEEIDRVMDLEGGADDHVVKPFGIRELLARLRSMLRRVALDNTAVARTGTNVTTVPGDVPPPIVHEPLQIDLGQYSATINGIPLTLTRKEFELLALFAEHPGRAFSRDFLLANNHKQRRLAGRLMHAVHSIY